MAMRPAVQEAVYTCIYMYIYLCMRPTGGGSAGGPMWTANHELERELKLKHELEHELKLEHEVEHELELAALTARVFV